MTDPDEILDTYRSLREMARHYAIAGIPTEDDERVLIKRTAEACRVSAEEVQRVVGEMVR